jgi:hypothetical protein
VDPRSRGPRGDVDGASRTRATNTNQPATLALLLPFGRAKITPFLTGYYEKHLKSEPNFYYEEQDINSSFSSVSGLDTLIEQLDLYH